MTPTNQENMSSLNTNGQDTNASPRDQSTLVQTNTGATLLSPEIGPLSNVGFSNNLDVLTRLYMTQGTIELHPNSMAASYARHDATWRDLAATIPYTPQHMTPRNDLLQILFLLRNPSTLPVPALPQIFQSGVTNTAIYPVFQGGVPRAAADDAFLTQLLQHRNAVTLASVESTNRLLQQQFRQRALYPWTASYPSTVIPEGELTFPADITAQIQATSRSESCSDTISTHSRTLPLSLPVCLSRPTDANKLTEYQGLLRQQIQVFTASFEDAETHMRGRNKPVTVGQVGIRCRHCASVPVRLRQRGSTYFPSTKFGIYQAAQNMATAHFPVCAEVPASLATELQDLRATSTAGAGRRYWVESATELGLVDTEDAGMRFRRDIQRSMP